MFVTPHRMSSSVYTLAVISSGGFVNACMNTVESIAIQPFRVVPPSQNAESKKAQYPSKKGTPPPKKGTLPSKNGTSPPKKGQLPMKRAEMLHKKQPSQAVKPGSSRNKPAPAPQKDSLSPEVPLEQHASSGLEVVVLWWVWLWVWLWVWVWLCMGTWRFCWRRCLRCHTLGRWPGCNLRPLRLLEAAECSCEPERHRVSTPQWELRPDGIMQTSSVSPPFLLPIPCFLEASRRSR